MSGRSPAPKRSYGGRSAEERRTERRERLISAGLELFGTQGYAATSIERICSVAGVSTRNFYEEFTGREALLTTLHDQLNTRSSAALVEAFKAAAEEDLPTRIERAVRAFIEVTASDPRWARINYVEVIGVSGELERHRMAWRERWIESIMALAQDAVARGEAVDRDYRLAVVGILGAANNLVHHWSARGQDIPIDDIVTELTRMIVNAVTRP
jgi:AcrR family transcriptional regulator